MIHTTVSHNLDALNAMLAQYRQVSKRTNEEILVKQGNKLAFELRSRLREIAPPRGSIKSARLASLAAGGGIHIRPSIDKAVDRLFGLAYGRAKDGKLVIDVWAKRGGKSPRMRIVQKTVRLAYNADGKRLSAQAVKVKRELAMRELSIGFTALAGKLRPKSLVGGGEERLVGRYKQLAGKAVLTIRTNQQSLVLDYGTPDSELGTAMSTPKADARVVAALQAVTNDMAAYVADKHAKALAKQTAATITA